MDRVCSGYDIWQTALVSHVVVLVHRFMVTICEDSQPGLRLGCKCSRSAFLVGWSRRRGSFIRVRFGNGVQVFLLQSTGATGSMAATAVICYIYYQKLLLLCLKYPMKSSPCDSPSCVQAAFECDFSPPQSQRTCADRDLRRVRQ